MDSQKRIVTQLPLTELWDQTGSHDYVRGQGLSADAIRDRLRSGVVQFVVANCGHSLEWIGADDRFNFWKAVAQSRVVPPDTEGFRLEDYPGEYAFAASEWLSADGRVVIVLEQHH